MLDTMAQLARHSDLVIAGDGPLAAAVAERARAVGAEYLGPVGGRSRDQLLASAEVVIIPSVAQGERREGFPVTALEAMAAGASVVASRTGGLAELPPSAVSWVPPGDGEALVVEVGRLLADPAARHRQQAAGRRFAESMDWDRVGPRLVPVHSR